MRSYTLSSIEWDDDGGGADLPTCLTVWAEDEDSAVDVASDMTGFCIRNADVEAAKHEPIPADFPVRPLTLDESPKGRTTCLTCGLSWDDGVSTTYTPTPSGRCPFEYFHVHEEG